MKKLLAILLSMLMLCTMIPFAVVSASEGGTVVIEVAEEEVNAGDEIEVTVNLANNPGVISAVVEVLYDHDAFELVATWDEDEEAWMYPIEVGTTFKASSNKYITFGPLDTETGIVKKCSVAYVRGEATSNCTKELFFTATFKVKDDAVTGDYSFSIAELVPGNFRNMDKEIVPFTAGDAVSVHVNGTDPEPEEPVCEHEYEYDCSTNCSKCGEKTRPEAEHQYNYACDQYCNECGEKTRPRAKHNVTHVEAKPAVSCMEFGNVEYWYCDACGMAWLDEYCRQNTNLKAVMTSAPCVSNAEYPCQNGTCITCGMTVAADVPHSYDHNYDVDCNACGEIRVIVDSIITGNETSIRENDAGEGLAFKFNVDANNTVLKSYYKLNEETEEEGDIIPSVWKIDYSNCTVTLDPIGTCKLVSMGALVDNGIKSISVYARYVNCVENYYTIRIIDIPAEHLDTELTATPFYIYENAEGNQFIVYGNSVTASYNGVLGTVA